MKKFNYILFAVIIVVTLVGYNQLPDQIPIHWNVNGEVDNFANRNMVFVLMLMPMGIYFLFPLLRKIDPKRDNYGKFEKEYDLLRNTFTIFFSIFYIVSISATFFEVNISVIIPILIGIMFMIIGNYLTRIRQSFFIGIKTPWTLSSEVVWNKTHRLGGYMFVVAGILLIIVGILQNSLVSNIVITVTLVSILLLIPYSYILYKGENHE